MSETHEHRLKRLYMRSIRRGIKEMDLILGGWAKDGLAGLDQAELDLYDVLLEENDHDLYQWSSGQVETPARYKALLDKIMAG